MSTKLFVGNLSFKTREPDLAKAFEESGTVKSANIITRGPRSLGYGFVEFEKEEDAAKAVTAMNKKEIDGRPINVELARPHDPNAPRAPRAPRRARAPRANAEGAAPAAPTAEGAAAAAAAAPAATTGAAPRPRRQRAPRAEKKAPVEGAAAPAAGAAAPAAGAAPAARRPRRQRTPRTFTGEPSKTTLFVASLPFIVNDEGLMEIFEGLNVKEAHVVTRPNGKSKGYGFVTFENEADQVKAMQTVDKSIVEDREISVRPAYAPFRAAPKDKAEKPATEAAAAAADAAAPKAEEKKEEKKPEEKKEEAPKTEEKKEAGKQ